MTLVDSSAWMEFLHQQGSAPVQAEVARLIGAGEAAYCGAVELELLAGARTARDAEYVCLTLEMCTRLSTSEAVWAQAGQAQSQLTRKGRRAGMGDLLIAAVARAHGASVLTKDADFERIRDAIWHDLNVERIA